MPQATEAKAPKMPAATPISSQAISEFLQLKKALNELVSWELAPSTWDHLPMHFTEGGDEKQAQVFSQALKQA
jgi:hypothetical protein